MVEAIFFAAIAVAIFVLCLAILFRPIWVMRHVYADRSFYWSSWSEQQREKMRLLDEDPDEFLRQSGATMLALRIGSVVTLVGMCGAAISWMLGILK
jgi:hypothetical protein